MWLQRIMANLDLGQAGVNSESVPPPSFYTRGRFCWPPRIYPNLQDYPRVDFGSPPRIYPPLPANSAPSKLIPTVCPEAHRLSRFHACHNTLYFCLEIYQAIYWLSTCNILCNYHLTDCHLCPSSLFSII